MGIRTQIQVKSEDSGEYVINARLFSEITKRMPDGELLFFIDDNLNVKFHVELPNTIYLLIWLRNTGFTLLWRMKSS